MIIKQYDNTIEAWYIKIAMLKLRGTSIDSLTSNLYAKVGENVLAYAWR